MVRKTLVLSLVVLLAAVATASWAAEPAKTETKSTPWKITGQLEEACSCNAACPCWFGSKPSRMSCGGGEFVFIQKGTYGTTALDGLAYGFMGESPDNESMMESMGNWKFAYLYIDQKASKEQQEALRAIASQTMPAEASVGARRSRTPRAPIRSTSSTSRARRRRSSTPTRTPTSTSRTLITCTAPSRSTAISTGSSTPA